MLSALKKKGLSFSPPADRRTLLRRITYDLIGLPPTPEEVDRFLADRSPGAYEKVVDRLLADPRYGERWARHWLDPAGYADSEGILQEDLIRPNAWRYRDYVIRSLNDDKPYDRFLREQIAGDELFDYRSAQRFTPQIEEALTATGFLRTAVDATRPDFNAHQFAEYQLRMLNDLQTIVTTTAMAMPLHCARCHDHKYEPLSQRDYYRVQALFAGAVRPDGPLLPSRMRQVVAGGTAEQQASKERNALVDAAIRGIVDRQAELLKDYRLRSASERIGEIAEADRQLLLEALRADPAGRSPAQKALIEKHKAVAEPAPDVLGKSYPEFDKRYKELVTEQAAEEKKRILLHEIRAFYDQDAAPPQTKLLIRGEWVRKGETVTPGVPAVLDNPSSPFRVVAPPAAARTTGRRKAFAEWLTRPDHPLTARVIVNRVWAHHFGTGIVATLDNFGRSGAKPTNQALLDWLAAAFTTTDGRRPAANEKPGSTLNARNSTLNARNSTLNWSLKRLHRIIVTSEAYRQDSRMRTEAARVDPENTLLWRQRPRRLEAEAVRDGMLVTAGNLDPKMYGEPVPIETRAGGDIVAAGEEKGGRRSIYLLVRRSEPVAVLNAFDSPVMETNCTRRIVSATATQSLALMNSSFIATQAKSFAARILKERPPAQKENRVDSNTIAHAFRLAYSRSPSELEMQAAEGFLRAQIARYGVESSAVEQAYADFCQALLGANEFIYVD